MLVLDDTNFAAQVLKQGQRVVVDFWAPSCAPCVQMSKLLAESESKFPSLVFAKVNADDAVTTAATYGVRGLPTLVLIVDGCKADVYVGALSATKMDDLLRRWSAKKAL